MTVSSPQLSVAHRDHGDPRGIRIQDFCSGELDVQGSDRAGNSRHLRGSARTGAHGGQLFMKLGKPAQLRVCHEAQV